MEGRKEGNVLFNDALNTFYLRLYGRKEGNVLFNDTLNTFYLRLYCVNNVVKHHSDSERGNPLPPHRLLFPINSKGSFICTIRDRIAHTTAFVTPVVEHWLEREIAQWVFPMKDRSDDPSHHEQTLLPQSYISLLYIMMHSISDVWFTIKLVWFQMQKLKMKTETEGVGKKEISRF